MGGFATSVICWACRGLGSITIFIFIFLDFSSIFFLAFFFFGLKVEQIYIYIYIYFFNLRVFLIQIKYIHFKFFSGQGVPGNTLSCTWHHHWPCSHQVWAHTMIHQMFGACENSVKLTRMPQTPLV